MHTKLRIAQWNPARGGKEIMTGPRRDQSSTLLQGASARILAILLAWMLSGAALAVGSGDFKTGEGIFKRICSRCHLGAMPYTLNPWYNLTQDNLTASNLIFYSELSNMLASSKEAVASNSANIACLLQNGGDGSGIDCQKTVVALAVDGVENGGATADAAPKLRGSLSAPLAVGEDLHIHRGTVDIVVPGFSGTEWSYADTLPGAGEYTYSARVEGGSDPSTEALGPDSGSYTITLDTTPPAGAGAIADIQDGVAPVTGTVSYGGTTNATRLELAGAVPLGSDSAHVYANGVLLGNAPVSGASWRFAADGLADGTAYSFTVRAYSAAKDQEGPDSLPYPVHIDATPPAQTIALAVKDDQNNVVIGDGGTTIDTSPALAGRLSAELAAGDTVHVYRSGQDFGQVAAPGLDWTFADKGLAAGNSYAYTARVVDAAGNLGPESNLYRINVAVPVTVNLTGRVTLADGTPCRDVDSFFGTRVQTTRVVAVDEQGQEWGAIKTMVFGPGGEFQLFAAATKMPTRLRATCEGTDADGAAVKDTAEAAVNLAGPTSISFSNNRPVITGIAIFYPADSQSKVVGVPAGSRVRVQVSADDPDGDALQYRWAGNTELGEIAPASKPGTAFWTVPRGKGLQTLYVQVSDGRASGYATGPIGKDKLRVFPITVSTDYGVVPDEGRDVPILGRADLVFGHDQMLAYAFDFGHRVLDSRKGACQYYKAVRLVADCQEDGTPIGPITLRQWQKDSKLGRGKGDRREVNAIYRNRYDLNLGRNMHARALPNGEAAFNVCNSIGSADLARLGLSQPACVAMDYRRIEGLNDGKPFLRAMVFGPGGELRLSVDLDGRGEKYVPGSCAACHGGANYFNPRWDRAAWPAYPEDGSGPPDLGMFFLPFDLDNFEFSSVEPFTLAAQRAKFKKLNQIVHDTNASDATRALIEGWYPKKRSSRFQGEFVPEGWSGSQADKDFYLGVVKHYCRTCHVSLARPFRANLDFDVASDVANTPNFFTLACGTQSPDGRLGDIAQFARMPNVGNSFTLFHDNKDPRDYSAAQNQTQTLLASYFDLLKQGNKAAASGKALLDENCQLPWLNEALWGPLPDWQRGIKDSIPTR
jgi:mono/diheme cytochrome c family protein